MEFACHTMFAVRVFFLNPEEEGRAGSWVLEIISAMLKHGLTGDPRGGKRWRRSSVGPMFRAGECCSWGKRLAMREKVPKNLHMNMKGVQSFMV